MTPIHRNDIEERLNELRRSLPDDPGFSLHTMWRIHAMTTPSTVHHTARIVVRLSIAAAATIAIGIAITLRPSGESPDSGGANSAFAQLVESVRNARSVRYRSLDKDRNAAAPSVHYMVNDGPGINRMRTDFPDGRINIWTYNNEGRVDYDLDPATHIARLVRTIGVPEGPRVMNMVAYSSQIDAARDQAVRVRPDTLDGRPVDVFSFKYEGNNTSTVTTIWVDRESRLPVRKSDVVRVGSQVIADSTSDDYEWNFPVDDALFDLTPPPGYELVESTRYEATVEKIAQMLRIWVEASGGTFPDQIDVNKMTIDIDRMIDPEGVGVMTPRAAGAGDGDHKPEAPESRMTPAALMRHREKVSIVYIGAQEAGKIKASDRDFHYAGSGVKPNQPDTPIVWFKTDDGSGYHVIYADLSTVIVDPSQLPD